MRLFSSSSKYNTLSSTQILLLDLLKAQLWLNPVDDMTLPSSIETWDDLLNQGYKQTVICFIAAACLRHKDAYKIPLDIKEELEAVIEENKRIHQHHNKILVELITKFEEQGLHPILLKGQGIAYFYDFVRKDSSHSNELDCKSSLISNSILRQCGDFDIYFSPNEYQKAEDYIRIIEDSNCQHEVCYHHYETTYKGIICEIHKHVTTRLLNPLANHYYKRIAQEGTNQLSNINIGEKQILIPSIKYNLIFVFVHMWRHFEDKGVSLRQICDVAVLTKYYYNIQKQNSDEIKIFLRGISYLKFWKIVGCIQVDFLGLEKKKFELYDSKFLNKAVIMVKSVFDNGAFNYGCGNDRERLLRMSKFRHCLTVHKRVLFEHIRLFPVVGFPVFLRYGVFLLKENFLIKHFLHTK